ncbi:hypothetical protein KM043_006823 [Ampulex compressa]|nr:hypothetical protein KM043_006823 [Ampulex compressa]
MIARVRVPNPDSVDFRDPLTGAGEPAMFTSITVQSDVTSFGLLGVPFVTCTWATTIDNLCLDLLKKFLHFLRELSIRVAVEELLKRVCRDFELIESL